MYNSQNNPAIFGYYQKMQERRRLPNGMFLFVFLLLSLHHQTLSFQFHKPKGMTLEKTILSGKGSGGDNDGEIGADDLRLLNDRLQIWRIKLLEEEISRPPNPDLSPVMFVVALLDGLWKNSDPLPDFGFRQLIRSSTPTWKASLYRSVGAPLSTDVDLVASALGEAMGRPNNQYAILLGDGGRGYAYDFPSDALDYVDGTCWIECRLRDPEDNKLLCATGWQLAQRSCDGAWLVDGIDWQDFRDEFRPGIGREEWMRICG